MYQPKYPPINADIKALTQYVNDELQSMAQAQGDTVDFVQFNVLHAAPSKPRDGMVAWADGTDWGAGGGLYQYVGGWKRLGDRTGTVALVAGTATVSMTSITNNSRIFVASQVDGGTPGWLRISARTAGASFTITSSSGTDTSTVAYLVVEP